MSENMTLDTDEPDEALRQVANYLRTVDMTAGRAVTHGAEVAGYWQCTDWIEGLLEIAGECDRVRENEFQTKLNDDENKSDPIERLQFRNGKPYPTGLNHESNIDFHIRYLYLNYLHIDGGDYYRPET